MRRTLLASALSACFGLIVATSWVLLTPTPAFAAEGSAKCSGGKTVTCEAQSCICWDNMGCTACNQGSDGKWNCSETKCQKTDEEMILY